MSTKKRGRKSNLEKANMEKANIEKNIEVEEKRSLRKR
jgi:hypothetical protein